MISIFGRVRSMFSSSASSIKAEAEEQNEYQERALDDIEELIQEQILDSRSPDAPEGGGLTEEMDANGSGGNLGPAGEEKTPAPLKPKRTKSKTVSKKRRRNSKKVVEPENGEPDPESHEVATASLAQPPANLDAPVEDIEANEPSPQVEQIQSRSMKKSPGGKKQRKSGKTTEMIEPEPHVEDNEKLDDAAAVAEMLNKASKRKRTSEPILPGMKPRSMVASRTVEKSPQLVIKPRLRTSLISIPSAGEERTNESLGGLLPGPSEIFKMVKKAKKTPQRTKRQIRAEEVVADITENDSTTLSQNPLNSAVIPPCATEDSGEQMSGVECTIPQEISPNAHFEGADDVVTTNRPSKKALGKRKASESTLRTTKKRARNSQASPNTDIRIFGTFTPSNEANASTAVATEQPQPLEVAQSAEDQTGGHIRSNFYDDQRSSLPAINGLGQGRRGTPQFTPINQKLSLSKSSYNIHSSPQVVLNSAYPTQKPVIVPSSQSIDQEQRQAPEYLAKADSRLPPVGGTASTSTGGKDTMPPEARSRRRLPTGNSETPIPAMSGTPNRAKKSTPKTLKPPKTPKPPATARARSTPGTTGKRLTESEIQELTEAVESYQSQNSLDQTELIGLIQGDGRAKSDDILSFWNELCSLIPDIPRAKVMSLCRRKYHSYIRGAWSEEQDDDLRVAVAQNPGKWKIIGPLLNRFPEDARLHWRDYVSCGNVLRKDVWDHEEEDRLRDCVNECLETLQEDKRESKDKAYKAIDAESQIDWMKVSKMMDSTRSRLQCMNKWKHLKDRETTDVEDATTLAPIAEAEWRLTDAVNKASQLKTGDKLALLRAIRDSAAGREGKIPWRAIAESANKKGKRMVMKVCFRNLRMKVHGQQEMKLQEIVAYLINAFEAAAPKEPQGFMGMDTAMMMSSQSSIKGKSRGQSETYSVKGDRRTKKGRGDKKQKKSTSLAACEGSDNGEGSSTMNNRNMNRSRHIHTQQADDDTPIPRRKQTVRGRIADHDPSTSQDADGADDVEYNNNELKTAWELTSTPRAKKPIFVAKTSQRKNFSKSEARIVESDEGEGEGGVYEKSTSNNEVSKAGPAPRGSTGIKEGARGVEHSHSPSNNVAPADEDLDMTDDSAVPNEGINAALNENATYGHGSNLADSSDPEQEDNALPDNDSVKDQSEAGFDIGMVPSLVSRPSNWSGQDVNDIEDIDQIIHEPRQADVESLSDKESAAAREDIVHNGSLNDVISSGNSDDASEDNDEQISNDVEAQSEDDVRNDPFDQFSGLPLSLPNGDRTYDSSDDSGNEYRRRLFDENKEYEDDDEHHITMNGFSRNGTVESDAESASEDFDHYPRRLSSPLQLSVSSDDTTSSIPPVAITASERTRRKAREPSIEL